MMREKIPSKTMTMMLTATGALIVMLIFMAGSVIAQVGVNSCSDKCEGDMLYLKGVWDEKLGVCVYDYQESCKYNCKDEVSCKEFPDDPPTNEADFDETLWKMQRRVYDSARIDISTGATEYQVGDNATIFAKVTEYGMGMNNAFCDAMIFNSSQDEIMGFQMTYVPNSRGMYSYTTQVPNDTGVYMVDAQCYRPINETFQTHYFFGEGIPAYDLGFKNQSGSGQTYIEFEDVNSVYLCHPDRFSVAFGDFESGEFEGYRFLMGIHNQSVYISKAVGVEKLYTVVLRYYKETEKGELTLGAAINHTLIGTSIKEVTFPDTVFNEPFDSMCLLEIEVCMRTAHDVGNDIVFWFNSTDENAKFDVHGLAVNASVDFEVGGSSEMHVSNYMGNITVQIQDVTQGISDIPANVWNYSNRNLTYINFSEVLNEINDLDVSMSGNFSEILGYLTVINSTVQITNDTVYDIWSFQIGELSNNLTEIQLYLADINDTAYNNYNWLIGIVNLSAYDVWDYTVRELTPVNDTFVSYVGGTEYSTGEEAQYIVQILKTTASGTTPINNASCFLNAYLPNGSLNLVNFSMPYLAGSNGIYRANKTINSTAEGVFSIDVTCTDGVKVYHTSGTAHVSSWANKIKDLNFTEVLTAINNTNQTLYQAIADSNSSIIARMDVHNGTIMTKLYLMQGEIASVNDSVNNLANLTAQEMWSYFNRTLTELNFTAEINDTNILNAISATNSTLYQAIADTNSSLLQAIIDSNTSIIGRLDLHNNTIMLKLYSVGTQIANLNDLSASEVWSFGTRTLTDYNQSEIINLLNNINTTMYNLTIGNLTVSATVNWTEGAVKMNNITDPIIIESQLLTFAGRDQTPVETISRSYCLDGSTLAYDRNTTRCWLDQCYTINDTLTESCDYGCYLGSCNPEPFDRITFIALIFLFVIVIIVLMALAYDRFVR